MLINNVDVEYSDSETIRRLQKENEEVLCVKNKHIDEMDDIEVAVNRHGFFQRRGNETIEGDGAETDKTSKQIIPYLIYVQYGKVLTYKKNKKSSESRLHDLYSIGIGGHVNKQDGAGYKAVLNASIRESVEEISVYPGYVHGNYIIINLDEDGVSRYHLGFASVITDWNGTVKLSDEIDGIEWLTLDELEERNLEGWSRYCVGVLREDFGDVVQ